MAAPQRAQRRNGPGFTIQQWGQTEGPCPRPCRGAAGPVSGFTMGSSDVVIGPTLAGGHNETISTSRTNT